MSLKNWNIDATWTLFLDRDGVINERILGGYVTKVEDFHFRPGVLASFPRLSQLFHRTIVVTNQQGIAKGLMDERNLIDVHTYMCDEVYRYGGRIEKCYFAPGLANDPEDDMRKPKTGMGELAKMEFPEIDFHCSVMVGDSDSDIQFGRNLGMRTVRVLTDQEKIGIEADTTVDSLEMFVNLLENEK